MMEAVSETGLDMYNLWSRVVFTEDKVPFLETVSEPEPLAQESVFGATASSLEWKTEAVSKRS